MTEIRENRSLTGLPWSSDLAGLIAEATGPECAGCLFMVEPEIPARARQGYAALVIAYTRDGEPVTIFEDGAALLLIKSGGIAAARIAANRIMDQMRRLNLEMTVRAAVIEIDESPQTLEARARTVAATGSPGTVTG